MIFTLPGIEPAHDKHLRCHIPKETGELLLVVHPWPLGHETADQDHTWEENVKRAALLGAPPPDRPQVLAAHEEYEQRLTRYIKECTAPVGVLFDLRERMLPSLELLRWSVRISFAKRVFNAMTWLFERTNKSSLPRSIWVGRNATLAPLRPVRPLCSLAKASIARCTLPRTRRPEKPPR